MEVIKREGRLVNFELLRVISMLMIIEIHLLGKSSLLWEGLPINSFPYAFCWFVYAFCMTSVNCYVIISGYFLFDTKWKLKKALGIYAQVLFYSIVIYIVVKYFLQLDLASGILNVLFPITRVEYWFATIYLGLYCLYPFVNILIHALDKIQLQRLILTLTLFFSVIPTVFNVKEWLGEKEGYSLGWFIFLYLLGGYIKKYDIEINRKKLNFIIGYVS